MDYNRPDDEVRRSIELVTEPLLPRVAAGDSSAIQACLDRYGKLVWSLARRFTSSRTDAEDAVQEVFIELWSCASRFDAAKATETTFVSMIARRRLIDRLRKNRREPNMEDLDKVGGSAEADVPSHADELVARDEAARASRLMRTLKPEQQKIIELSIYQGQTHQRIAETLNLPLGTVKTHLRRGLLRIRDAMQTSGTVSSGGRG